MSAETKAISRRLLEEAFNGGNLAIERSSLDSLPQPRFMPCASCGESVVMTDLVLHQCEEERRAAYQVFQLRDGYLESPRGSFETWYAERRR